MIDAGVSAPAFAAVDWGTSSFRLWLIGGDGDVLAESRGTEGMMHCTGSGFAPVLARHLAKAGAQSGLPVIICGMAGARQGWVEAPYLDSPTALDALPQSAVLVAVEGHDVRILPGLCQRDPLAPNVMRGEETQLLGLSPATGARLICMPGTHCKWVAMDGGTVTAFRTYMTGDLFAVLSRHSILRHAVDAESRPRAGDPAFLTAFDAAVAQPQQVWSRLFELRPAQLLDLEDAGNGAAHLSGLLIGAEIGAERLRSPLRSVTLVASGGLGDLYETALVWAGFEVTVADAEEATRKGLIHAARNIWGSNHG